MSPVLVRSNALRQLHSGCYAIIALSALSVACGASRQAPAADSKLTISAGTGERSERHWDKKPSLSVTERSGDPVSALALATKASASPVAIVTFANILRKRLTETARDFEIFPNAFGLTLVSPIANPNEAVIVTRSIESALSSPIDSKLLDARTIAQVRETLNSSLSQGSGELTLANCTGELIVEPKQLDILNNKAELLASVEAMRVEMHSRNNARFGFVGTSTIAHAVESAVDQLPPWPASQPIARQAPFEAARELNDVTVAKGALRSLSIAWRVGSIATANCAAQAMRRKGSPLLAQVLALDTEWKVDTISAIARDVGACLRIDLTSSRDVSPLSQSNLETITRVVSSESRSTLQTSIESGHEDIVSLLDNDPRIAARRAAWNSLSSPDPSRAQSLQIHLRTSQIDGPPAPLEAVLRGSFNAWPARPLDAVYRLEAGQSEQWALLASQCGTSAETADDAGSMAAWVHAIARRYTGHLGVQIEPWVTADGVGFIAHGQVQSRTESSSALATRLGNALGSIVATGSVSGPDLAAIRENTLLRLGPSPRRAWWQLVQLAISWSSVLVRAIGEFRFDAQTRLSRPAYKSTPMAAESIATGHASQSKRKSARPAYLSLASLVGSSSHRAQALSGR